MLVFLSFRYHTEYYKYDNYGHIAHDFRSMMKSSTRENTDIRYKKVWRRKKQEQVHEGILEVIPIGFVKFQYHNEYMILQQSRFIHYSKKSSLKTPSNLNIEEGESR